MHCLYIAYPNPTCTTQCVTVGISAYVRVHCCAYVSLCCSCAFVCPRSRRTDLIPPVPAPSTAGPSILLGPPAAR